MLELPEFCEGFHFQYFSADESGRKRRAKPTRQSLEAEEKILNRVAEVLRNRPDVMEHLACLENALEVHLYQGTGFSDFEAELYFYGRATVEGDEVILEFATDEVLYGGRQDHEVLDVVVHELVHVIDLLDDEDGVLPGWKAEDIRRFEKARERERDRIRCGTSPLPGYALTNDLEFLAVLVELFFVKPGDLQRVNPDLYRLVRAFFRLDPGNNPSL